MSDADKAADKTKTERDNILLVVGRIVIVLTALSAIIMHPNEEAVLTIGGTIIGASARYFFGR